jgi:hypothetical protein
MDAGCGRQFEVADILNHDAFATASVPPVAAPASVPASTSVTVLSSASPRHNFNASAGTAAASVAITTATMLLPMLAPPLLLSLPPPP